MTRNGFIYDRSRGLCIRVVYEHKFTGKERDAESGNDYFGARYYGTSMGRFMSPDPTGGHLENPQSLNKYSYALNNPLTNTDPTGLDSYLQCTQTNDNASSCQSQTVGYDKNGNAQTAGQTPPMEIRPIDPASERVEGPAAAAAMVGNFGACVDAVTAANK